MKYHKIVSSLILPVLLLCACNRKQDEEPPIPVVDFHSELQANYLNDAYGRIAYYANGNLELSKPKGHQIYFNNPEHYSYAIYLKSEIDNRSFVSDGETFIFNNLYLDTLYHYELRKDGAIYAEGDFKTTDVAPRNLDVDGVTNVRDLGGYLTQNGKRTKQGLIYRSAKFNANESDDPLITDTGRDVVVEDLRIKSEIDLRMTENNESGQLTESVIDESVKYYAVPMDYNGAFLEINKEPLKNLFDIISIRDNYPFVFHCSIGTDRTGMVAFILNALLEVKVEEIYRDYLFSNFGIIGGNRNRRAIDKYIGTMNDCQGNTLKEQVISYLISIGVARSQIDSFLEIMNA